MKRRLRAESIAAILGMSEADRAARGARILDEVRGLASYRGAGTVLLYLKAFPEEIETGPLLADALAAGRRVACPRVVGRAAGMVLHEVRDLGDLRAGTLGIPEPVPDAPIVAPEDLDWVLAPGVAFDPACNRLGRGAGHYDRLLPRVRPGIEVWAAAFDVQMLDMLPVEPHDVPLTGVVTESRILRRA
ncbi:MAG: 5-formyltetrahydrofolate cyclo-ligase [Planctomycetales bacterium 71-10]|nr:MAG: 5-formyltetrahydrofolate cyclo-ligase [Planctomycetales bacterium 71-10]